MIRPPGEGCGEPWTYRYANSVPEFRFCGLARETPGPVTPGTDFRHVLAFWHPYLDTLGGEFLPEFVSAGLARAWPAWGAASRELGEVIGLRPPAGPRHFD